MVVGLVLDLDGWPLCCELWPGNTADVTTLIPVVQRMRQRFRVRKVCIVADRGMISAKTTAALEAGELDCDYILGARMRSVKEVCEHVVADRGRYRVVHPPRQTSKDPSPLKVKEVTIGDRRYVVCLNEEQRRKDAADRRAIVAALREQLKQGDKELVGNKGYRKYLQPSPKEHFAIDEAKIRKEYAIANGGLPSIDGWARCDFIGPSKITIDAGREMAQEREDVARGLMTRRDHYGNRGRSWRRETDQVFEEIDYILDRAKAIAEEHDIPVETVMANFGLAAAKGASGDGEKDVKRNVSDSGDDGEKPSDDAGDAGAND